MNRIRNFLLAGFNTLSKVLAIVIINKLILLYYGQKEFLIYGDVISYLNIFVVLGTLGMSNSIIVYSRKQQGLRSSVLFLASVFSIVLVSVLILVLLVTLDIYTFNILKSIPYRIFFVLSGIALVTVNFKYSYLISEKRVSTYHSLQILQNLVVIGLVLVGVILKNFSLVVYSLGFSALLYIYPQLVFFKRLLYKGLLFKRVFKNTDISSFMIVGIFSSLVNPSIHILGRSLFVNTFDLEVAAGYHASLKVSEGYMLFVNLVLVTMLLPKFSEISEGFVGHFGRVLGLVFIFFILLFSGFFVFRDTIYTLIFEDALSKYSYLSSYMIISDFFRTISLSLALFFYAKKHFLVYASLELFSAVLLFVGMSQIGSLSITNFYLLWIFINACIACAHLGMFLLHGRK